MSAVVFQTSCPIVAIFELQSMSSFPMGSCLLKIDSLVDVTI